MKNNRLALPICFFVVLSIFLFAVAYCIPYTHDDWDWGRSIGISQLIYATVNSRYMGNLLVVLLTRSEVLKTLVIGLFFLCMPLFSVYLCTGRKLTLAPQTIILTFLAYALYLGFPTDIWSQTNGWVAGFANYSFSVVLLAVFIKLSFKLFDKDRASHPGIANAVLCFFSSLILQLFLENITVYIAAVSVCIFAADWIYHKKPSASAIAILLGSLLGAVIMFSSNIYGSLLSTGQAVGDYRQLTVDLDGGIFALVYQVIYNYIAIILSDLYKTYWQYPLVLLVILLFLSFKKRSSISGILFAFIQAANCILILYFSGQLLNIDELICKGNTRYMAILRLGTAMALFFLVALEIFLFEKNRKRALLAFAIWLSAPLVTLPLAVVNTVGPRSFYTSIFFISLVILIMADLLIQQLKKPGLAAASVFCTVAFLAVCIRLGCVYYEVGQVKIQRDLIISAAIDNGASEVVLPDYRDKDYLWLPNPGSNINSFKEFYGLDTSVKLTIE